MTAPTAVPAPPSPAASSLAASWCAVCSAHAIRPGRAVGVHVRGLAVAVFRTYDDELFALADRDPLHVAERVLSTGRIASRRDRPVVEAATTGRVFELAGGRCVDGGPAARPVPVRVTDGAVEIRVDLAA